MAPGLRPLRYVPLALVAAGILLMGSASFGLEYVANVQSKLSYEGRPFPGKMWVKGKFWREEKNAGIRSTIIIGRPDRGEIWELNPSKKTYTAIGCPDYPKIGSKEWKASIPSDTVLTYLGKEKKNGYMCEKYSARTRWSKHKGEQTIWYAPKLNEVIRLQVIWPKNPGTGVQPTQFRELSNVRMTKVPASMFDLPRGYTRVDATGMGGGGSQ